MLVCSIVLSVSLGSSLIYESISFSRDNKARLNALAGIIAADISAALAFNDGRAINKTLQSLEADSTIIQLYVLNVEGEVAGWYVRSDLQLMPHDIEQHLEQLKQDLQKHKIFDFSPEIRRPVISGGEQLGCILAELDSGVFSRKLLVSGSIGAVILLLSVLGSYLLARRLGHIVTDPVESLAATMKEVSRTKNYHARAELCGVAELNQLSEGFNEMLDVISQRDMALQESEYRWKFAIEGSGDGVWDWDIQNNILSQNKRWMEILGFAEGESLPAGQEWADRIHPEDQLFVAETMKSYLEGVTETYVVECRMRCKDDSYKWIHGRGVVVNRRPDGTPLRMIGTSTDITQRKQAEENLKKSEELYHSLVETSQDLIWRCDAEGRYTYLNLAWEQVLGYELDEMLGKKFSDFQTPENAAHDLVEFNRLLEGNSVTGLESTYVGKSGKEINLVFNALFMSDDQGNIIGMSGTAFDITQRKLIEAELHQAKSAAEFANIAKSQFLANMSHEIRTPMNGVIGMTQLLEMTDLTDEQREYVATLRLSGKNLLSLINDILDLSKIEAGEIKIELSAFNLNQCINDVIMLQKFVTHEKGLTLDSKLAGDVPPVLIGDQLRIKQVLNNLLGNAVKFTAQGSISISTQLLEQHDDTVLVQIAVRDSGIGISADALDKIFMPFTQEDGSTTRKFGGTGLGLTISRRLTELLGGGISVESRPGVGSCFTVILPFATTQQADSTEEALPKTMLSWDGPPRRVLFAEDNPINTKLGTLLLRKLGYDVVVVKNGRECLATLEQGCFDIVLMDIQMPIINGEEALYEIRRRERGASFHQPVIAVTAYSLRGDKERFLAEGFDGYVSKPLEIKELMAAMDRVMRMAGETAHDLQEESNG